MNPHSKRWITGVVAVPILFAIIAYGSSRTAEGLKFDRYAASAGSVLLALKWWANEYGMPISPATWAV